MSPVVDETARDLPVRDVGLMRKGLMPTVPDIQSDGKPWKKTHVLKTKDQRLFRFPREHLEDLCVRLQDENGVLRQHIHSQEQKLRRMATSIIRVRQAHPGSRGVKEKDMEETIKELEAHVAMLESQKGLLQNKLSMAKQHILDLGGCTPYKYSKGKIRELDGGIRRPPKTAPPHYGPIMEDTRFETERFRSGVAEQVRVAELELTAQALRETLREKEKEIEETVTDIRKQQADKHRINIREDVDIIRLQKLLTDKSTALRVVQEKFNNLQEAYENQLEESQRSLTQSHEALLEKVEQLTEQLRQERQRALVFQGQLSTSTLSLQTVEKLQDRIAELEGERDLIKENYDTLLERSLAPQKSHNGRIGTRKDSDQNKEMEEENTCRLDIQTLEEREEINRLKLENENLRAEKEVLEEQKEREKEFSMMMRDKQQHLEREALHYKEQVSALQERLNSVTEEFDMSVEDLSEILLQIKAFRMQHESRAGLGFLRIDEKVENSQPAATNIHASHAETVLELKKTRNLLLLENRISKDLQEELNTINQKMEREREESRRRAVEKDSLLAKRLRQINSLQTQIREFAYSPKRTIPIQYMWPSGELEQQIEEDIIFSQLRAGESLLEIHLKEATFTPAGLRAMGRIQPGVVDRDEDIVTFCTYSLLDFEILSTPLVSGSKPSYSFTSHYTLTAQDQSRLEREESRIRVELHQALGGVRFLTHGSGQMSLLGAMERRGERISRCLKIIGSQNEIIGVVDLWLRLFNPTEPIDPLRQREADRTTGSQGPVQTCLGWHNAAYEEIYDFGWGIPNELEVMLECCFGLNARLPRLYPDAYLTYKFYDLPNHVSQTIKCTINPVFNDVASYPLAVTSDVLQYLRSSSLWIYVFDDGEDQIPPIYLAKTPIPLRVLASGCDIRGDYLLRDPAGAPQGMVRVTIKWKYPLQPSLGTMLDTQRREDGAVGSTERKERSRGEADAPQRPIAKPRVKTQHRPPSRTQKRSKNLLPEQPVSVSQKTSDQFTDKKRSTKSSPEIYKEATKPTPVPKPATRKSSERTSTMSRRSSASDVSTQDLVDDVEDDQELSHSAEDEAPESSESSSSQSDIIIIPPKQKMMKGDSLRVEIQSLTFEPSSHVVLDESVQRVYVEYRLLGIPMETTETPMSLRKPTEGMEIHYNFTRVIYVEGSQSIPLRHYLYTMLEGTDTNQGRLKFTVVSEPMDDDDECVDIGHAFLDLQELLLSGNDVINQKIDIVSVDEENDVIGSLKVSLEAAKALTGIYKEFCKNKNEEETNKEATEEEQKEEPQKGEKEQIQVIDYDFDSDFY